MPQAIHEKPGMVMVWTDVPAEVEPDFNEWYNFAHLPDRINTVPGFTPFMKQACTFRLLYTLHSMVGIDSAECSSSTRTHRK